MKRQILLKLPLHVLKLVGMNKSKRFYVLSNYNLATHCPLRKSLLPDAPPEFAQRGRPSPASGKRQADPNPRLHPMKTRRRAPTARHQSTTPTTQYHRQTPFPIDIDVALFSHVALSPPNALIPALRERNSPAHGGCRHPVPDIAWAASCL